MKYLVIMAFAGILGSLSLALIFLMKDKGKSDRMANALTVRISLSVLLFLMLLFFYWMGWITPTGLRLRPS
ncbi:MAG: twin transmembrane helix small protein [Burkholderiaceae bacterium]|nr:twin transmembrane helix small protein [Burkholderiaceae bacterium]